MEPIISGEIMELHHSKHHQAYVNGYNTAYKQFKEVQNVDMLSIPVSGDTLRARKHSIAVSFKL